MQYLWALYVTTINLRTNPYGRPLMDRLSIKYVKNDFIDSLFHGKYSVH